jgi:4-nitrophenyl phosphatase
LLQRAGCVNAITSGIISDLDGVAYRGEQPIRECVQAFQTWHARGVPYAFVTNNSTKSAAQFAAKLENVGIPATAAQVFNTIAATTTLLQQRWRRGTSVFAIREKLLFEALEESGHRLAGEDAEIVILGFDYHFTYAKLRTAVRAALGGATVIVTNPDVLTPVDDGYDPCVGSLAAAVTAAAPNTVPIVVGRPQPLMIEQALAYLGTTKSETVMIGDQIGTDIAAGQSTGLRSILIASDVPFNVVTGITPDHIGSSLLDLVDGFVAETAVP